MDIVNIAYFPAKFSAESNALLERKVIPAGFRG